MDFKWCDGRYQQLRLIDLLIKTELFDLDLYTCFGLEGFLGFDLLHSLLNCRSNSNEFAIWSTMDSIKTIAYIDFA